MLYVILTFIAIIYSFIWKWEFCWNQTLYDFLWDTQEVCKNVKRSKSFFYGTVAFYQWLCCFLFFNNLNVSIFFLNSANGKNSEKNRKSWPGVRFLNWCKFPRSCAWSALWPRQCRSPPARCTGPSPSLPPRATRPRLRAPRPKAARRTAWPPGATPSQATRTALWAPEDRPIPWTPPSETDCPRRWALGRLGSSRRFALAPNPVILRGGKRKRVSCLCLKKQYESERKGYFFKALLWEVERLVLFDNLNSSGE